MAPAICLWSLDWRRRFHDDTNSSPRMLVDAMEARAIQNAYIKTRHSPHLAVLILSTDGFCPLRSLQHLHFLAFRHLVEPR